MAQQLKLFDPAPPAVAPVAPAPAYAALATAMPRGLCLGTSSWSFPGWRGLVYAPASDVRELARQGLRAYAEHPLLNAVGVDRTFHAALTAADYRAYAEQVPASFRFVVKAPAACTTPRWRARDAQAPAPNPHYLDVGYAMRCFVEPCLAGLGAKLGVFVFQFPPQGAGVTHAPARFAQRLGEFLEALPRGPRYHVELRDRMLLGDAYAQALRRAGAAHCISVHPRMPRVPEQARLTAAGRHGALVVRWNLHAGFTYEQARTRYRPFDRLIDPDPQTRRAIVVAAKRALHAAQPVFITVNNKAEGSAPLSVFGLASALTQGA